MRKRFFLLALYLTIAFSLCAQNLFDDDTGIKNDIIKVNYTRKNAKLAMLMSAILPGAGQYYSNKKSITTYIFPVIEAGLIYGYISYMDKGHQIEKDYQNYATNELIMIKNSQGDTLYTGARYNVSFQFSTQDNLMSIHVSDIYDNIFFKWNALNLEYNQHFYEDIGKYNKYIFGWADWHYEYAFDGENDVNPVWIWNADQTIWNGNEPTNPDFINDQEVEPKSAFRSKYIKMRINAEKNYDKATNLSFAIVANHFVSAFDAIRVTHKINRNYLSQNDIRFNYKTTIYNSHFTPMLTVCKKF